MKASKIAGVLSVLALVFAAAGCQKSESAAAAGDSAQKVVEIEFVNMNPAWRVVDFGKDPVTARFIERTGVKMVCSAPQGDWQQIATVWLASQDYPEMMHMDSNNVIFDQYIVAGALHPINKLAEQYNYPKITNGEYIYPKTRAAWTKPDGNFYLVPNWYSEDGFGSVGQAVNVRNDIYNNLGQPTIDTMEDLYQYLLKIRDANLSSPDGAKLWALSYGSTDTQYLGWIANFWGSKIYRYNYFDEASRTVKFMLRSDTMVSALKWMSRALREGVLDPEALTYNSTTREQAYNQGKHGVIIDWFWNLWTPNSLMSQKQADMYFKAIPAPAGKAGVQPWHGHYHISGTSGTMITKKAKNPEAAMKFVDFFLSPEGETLNFYGIEGKTMEFVNGQPRLYPEAYEAKLADWNGYAESHGIRIFDFMNNQKYNWERQQESPGRQADRAIANKYAFDGTIQVVTVIDALSEEGILLAEIQANITAQLIKIIQEPNDARIEQMVKDLLAEYERKGVAKLEASWTKQYLEKLANL